LIRSREREERAGRLAANPGGGAIVGLGWTSLEFVESATLAAVGHGKKMGSKRRPWRTQWRGLGQQLRHGIDAGLC